jgi:hypothetical protein
MLLALGVLVGRVESSRADIEGVADGAARSISLSRSTRAAAAGAKADAEASLHVGSSTCRTMGWDVEVSAGRVTVTVACTIDLSAASILPVPAHDTVRATATEVIDRFRETTS